MSAATFSSDSRKPTEEKATPAVSREASRVKLERIIEQAQARRATHGAIARLREGRLREAQVWLNGCCLFDLARDVEGVIAAGA